MAQDEEYCVLAPCVRQELASLDLICMVCVAALGFGDIPPGAFVATVGRKRSDISVGSAPEVPDGTGQVGA